MKFGTVFKPGFVFLLLLMRVYDMLQIKHVYFSWYFIMTLY